MVSILGSFDHRLSALETAMRPTQVIWLSVWIEFDQVFFRVLLFVMFDLLFDYDDR
jgi:hypothetical protein